MAVATASPRKCSEDSGFEGSTLIMPGKKWTRKRKFSRRYPSAASAHPRPAALLRFYLLSVRDQRFRQEFAENARTPTIGKVEQSTK
jgi:hypothetical protein